MSDRRDRHEFMQLVDETMNFGDADQFTENDADIRAALLHAYFKVPMTNESGPPWAGSLAPTATHQ